MVQSPIEKALATRNMLRSRKKGLENNAKKSDDVKGRQDNKLSDAIELTTQEESKVNVPALETISEQVNAGVYGFNTRGEHTAKTYRDHRCKESTNSGKPAFEHVLERPGTGCIIPTKCDVLF